MLRAVAVMVAKKVFTEDGAIYQSVQNGMAASPHAGVIGTREERIYSFQKYVLENTVGAAELPLVEQDENRERRTCGARPVGP